MTSGNSRRGWTTAEVAALRVLAPYGVDGCSQLLGRSRASVQRCATRNRIELRVTSTDATLTPDARRVLTVARASTRLPLCVRCVARPATAEEGLCRVCWLDHLIEAYKGEVIAAVHARERARLRQVKHRGRVCPQCSNVYSSRRG